MLSGLTWIGLLFAGLVLGTIARLVLWRRISVSWAATILVGIIGAGLGTTLLSTFRGSGAFQFNFLSATSAVGGSVAVLGIYALVASRLHGRTSQPIDELLTGGESDKIEFKQTARHNIYTDSRDPKLELAVVKTIAGFLNSSGGTLLIGVTDNAEPVGLDDDLQHMKQPDLDRYQLWLTDLFESSLGSSALASITISFPRCGELRIGRVDVRPHSRAVFVNPSGGSRAADFYVRTGNSTRLMLTDEAMAYAASRWRWWRHITRRS